MPKKKTEDLKYGVHHAGNESAYQAAKFRTIYYRPSIYINKEKYPSVVEAIKAKPNASEYIISLILADLENSK